MSVLASFFFFLAYYSQEYLAMATKFNWLYLKLSISTGTGLPQPQGGVFALKSD